MKLIRWMLVLAIGAALAVPNAAAELYVVSVGAGAAALGGSSTRVAAQLFGDTGGAPLATLILPTAASEESLPFTISGSAVSEGFLALSPNGQYLTLGGYAVAPGVAGIATTTSTVAPRAVARYDLNTAVLDITTVFSGDSTYSGGNIRSAVTNDGGEYWTSGSNQGLRYANFGANTSASVSNTVTNARVAKIFGGQLYASSAIAPFVGINSVGSGLPTESDQTITNLFTTSGSGNGNASPYDFFRKDANTFYVADDRTAANGGGIQKWEFNTGTSSWGLSYTIPLGATGARGLSGATINGATMLYATSAESNNNYVYRVTDNGMGSTAAAIAQAGFNKAFRGVAFAAPKYQFTSIDFPGAAKTTVNNIDNAGRIVGQYEDSSASLRGFVWENGVFTIIHPGNVGPSSANGINASDQIVGSYTSSSITKAYIRNGGAYTDLNPFPDTPEAKAYAINDAGHVAGYYELPGSLLYRSFFYDGTNYTTLNKDGAVGSQANGINNSDQIVGYYAEGSVIGSPHGFLYSEGSYTTIDYPVPDSLGTVAQGINDAGDIVGVYFDANDHDHGFIKTSSGYSTIDYPGAIFSGLVGINNSGQVVGYYRDDVGFHGFLATPVAAADFNGDGNVDGADLQVWSGNFGLSTGATKSQGDANADFAVDGADFLKWQTQLNFGAASASAYTAVPEPAALFLAVVSAGGLTMADRRRRA